MNMKKLMLASAVASSLAGLYGCSEGDDSSISITTTGSASTGLSIGCPSWSTAKPVDATNGDNVCALPATILEDRNLTNDIVWYLEGRVTVGNGNGEMSSTEGVLSNGGNVVSATLSLEPGTQVKAKKGTFANLVITRGSEIDARGTADEPIVFSSDDAGEDGTGEWGGLILHGYARHNGIPNSTVARCADTVQARNIDSEGESGFAGGCDDSDSSGVLRYVVVAEGGYEFAPGNEINGVSFVAVGSGTEVDHIQVHNNADDGVEFYGGTVDAKYLVLTNNLDDSIDWDEGYTGKIQYVIVKQSPDTGGNAIEADSEGSAIGSLNDFFLSKPVIANATFIGDGSQDTLLVFKKESAGVLHHTVLTGAAGSLIDTCVDSSDTTASASDLLGTTIVADCTTSGDTDVVAATIADVMLDAATYASGATEATTVGALYAQTVDEDFFDDTTYAGAVNPAVSDDWFSAWIVDGSL